MSKEINNYLIIKVQFTYKKQHEAKPAKKQKFTGNLLKDLEANYASFITLLFSAN